MHEIVIVLSALAYMAVLFGIAYWGDQRADQGRSLIANPYIYTLSIAVYCTAWTFYGSVGRAASNGISFLPVYLGPTMMAILFWFVLRRIIRIAKIHRITSIADFIASRYGKSSLVGGFVTVIAMVGIMPYISIQLKAIAISFEVLRNYPDLVIPNNPSTHSLASDTSFIIALVLIVFTILFGTRHIDNTERHEGVVAAVAFESLIKLLAFLAVGLFVTYGLFNGFSDLFQQASTRPDIQPLLTFDAVAGGYGGWLSLTFISMMAFLFLPRQFQVLVIENVNEQHLNKAAWLFPLYLLVINLFVLPIALAGLLKLQGQSVDADMFVLALPILEKQPLLALLVFLGGLSAATSMIIVETVALSTMICNDLVMPVLLRIKAFRLTERTDLSGLLLFIRRLAIAGMILLGYVYFRVIGESYALVAIGLISFVAAAQFAPAILIGLYWRRANRLGALMGLAGGFVVWLYTLLLPAFALSGWLHDGFVRDGLFGIALLKPYQLFGLTELDPYTHAIFWSMLVNIGGLVLGSFLGQQTTMEQVQASQFVGIFEWDRHDREALLWRGVVEVAELHHLLARFIGPRQADKAFADYAQQRGEPLQADAHLIHYTERLLAGAIGSASARVMVSSVVMGEVLSIDEVITILDESSQAIEYSHRLEQKSKELEAATAELREANARLQELDSLKDEFISTVTHELRTPLTSIRAFSEILLANPDIDLNQRSEFLAIIVKESERLTRLINDVLDLAKLESGRINWRIQQIDLQAIVRDAIQASRQLFHDKQMVLEEQLGHGALWVQGDADRLAQVIINLLSNAVKFSPEKTGHVTIRLVSDYEHVRVEVQDNGPGIPKDQQKLIFQKFHQVRDQRAGKPKGTGLGLAISERIIVHHNGRIWVESEVGRGSTFKVELPWSEEAYVIAPG